MGSILGPMPDAVRAAVGRLVEAARAESGGRCLGFLLSGGPGGCDYLDADGDVWSWSAWDDSVERVPDGPRKVGAVALASEREPGLIPWLPRRPPDAKTCDICGGSGSWPPPHPPVQCGECVGLGWLHERPRTEPGTITHGRAR